MKNIDTQSLLNKIEDNQEDSNLGFFSKPYRLKINNQEIIIKKYRSVKNEAEKICTLHDNYIEQLKNTGINIPETEMRIIKNKKKYILIILQKAFKKDELFREILQKSESEKIFFYLKIIFDDTIKFWQNKPENKQLGFHPTLRNYAFCNNKMFYFDSFPPMNLTQKKLNSLIMKMSPFASQLRYIIPNKLINIVSDEYYIVEKMIKGIVGSSCRIKPEFAEKIVDFSVNYVQKSNLSVAEKERTVTLLATPPRLSLLWRSVRKISGNIGQPNVK